MKEDVLHRMCGTSSLIYLSFSGRLYVIGRRNIAADGSICQFECLNVFPDQNQNLIIYTSIFNADRHTLNSHIFTPKYIFCVYYRCFMCQNVAIGYMVYSYL